MAIHYIRPEISGELRDPFDCDEQIVRALVTVGAFVALADGRVDAIERDEAVNYVDRQQLAPSISRARIAEFFDARARHLEDRDFADLIADALRPVAALSLTTMWFELPNSSPRRIGTSIPTKRRSSRCYGSSPRLLRSRRSCSPLPKRRSIETMVRRPERT